MAKHKRKASRRRHSRRRHRRLGEMESMGLMGLGNYGEDMMLGQVPESEGLLRRPEKRSRLRLKALRLP